MKIHQRFLIPPLNTLPGLSFPLQPSFPGVLMLPASMFLLCSVSRSLTSTLISPLHLLSSRPLVTVATKHMDIFESSYFLCSGLHLTLLTTPSRKMLFPCLHETSPFSLRGTLCCLLQSHLCGSCFFVHLYVLESLRLLTQVLSGLTDSSQSLSWF